MKRRFNRFLAGLCTTVMLSQSILDSGFVLYASAGEDVPAYEAVAETAEEEEEASGNEAAVSDEETEKTETSGEQQAALEDDGEDVNDPAEDDVKEPGEEEEEEEKDGPADERVIITDGIVKVGSRTYGVYKDGVFTISKTVDRIVPYFYEWKGLKKVEFEENAIASVIHVDDETKIGAFQGCPDLEEVDFTNASEMTIIDSSAFKDCEKLKKVEFNVKTQYIEDMAFAGCVGLDSVVIKKNIVSLGRGCFSGCESLESIRIEATNLSVDPGIFEGCNIKKFELESEVSSNNEIIPENLFNRAGFASDAVITIPDSVKEIGAKAFEASTINNIILPDGLTTISERAFNGCDELKAIDLKSVKTIDNDAFHGCMSIKTLVIPDTVIFIGDHAFKECSGINELTLGQGTKDEETLGVGIFEGCESLKTVEIPSPHKYVGVEEFKNCDGLSEVIFSNTVTTIGDSAFEDCDFLFEITLPSNKAFTTIPAGCFAGCDALMAIRISEEELGFREGITEIGPSAFEECGWFSYYSFPSSLINIGDFAFHKCLSIKEVTIPENVEYIGTSAFENCPIDEITIKSNKISECGARIFYLDLVRKINFPEGVNKIPANLFNQTTWVTDRTIIIPNTVEYIGDGAFLGSGNDPRTSNFFEIKFEEKEGGGYNIKEIGDGAFMNSRAIKEFFIPDTVTYIGESAFAGCDKLESIVIPESVTEIGRAAFADCSILSSITFNAIAVESSNSDIFARCNVKNITIGNKVRLFPDNLFKGAQFAQVTGTEKPVMVTIVVPSSTERIGSYSLCNIVNLQKVEFAEGSHLAEIGDYAFQECVNLESCALPPTVTSIGTGAFIKDVKLADVVLPAGLESLGASAFEGCGSITSVKIGSKLTEILNDTFYDCKKLAKVEFAPDAVIEAIGNGAFEADSLIDSISIPASVTFIGINAFSGCKIVSANFAQNGVLDVIEDGAFETSPIVKSLIIPDNVTVIGSRTFYETGASGKTQVYLPASVQRIGDEAFNIKYKDNLEFFVVEGSAADDWLIENGFIIKERTKDVEMIAVTFDLQGYGENYVVKVGKGSKLSKPITPEAEGVVFVGWYTDEACKKAYDFETTVEEEFTLYAKWSKKAEEVKGGDSALDPTPEITVSTNELWLVKGQKFYIGDGWTVTDKKSKKYVSISKGVFKAKKENGGNLVAIHHDSREEDLIIHICKPALAKTVKMDIVDAKKPTTTELRWNSPLDPHITNVLWYSANPDVATVDENGKVTAVGKGSAKVTAFVNGVAFTCTVKVSEKAIASERTMHCVVGLKKTIKLKGVKGAWEVVSGNAASMISKTKVLAGGSKGEAVIKNGDYTVNFYAEDITVTGANGGNKNKYTINLSKGESTDISMPGVYQKVVFKSSKPEVAFADEEGHVKANSAGTTKLTAKINGKTVTITVKVQ